MNNKQIAVVELNNFAPTLTKQEKQIVTNTTTPEIRTMKTRDVADKILTALSESVLIIGNKNLTEQDVAIMSKQVSEQLKVKNEFLKIGEILQSIKNGSFGEYQKDGEFLFLSAVNVFKWVTEYQYRKHESIAKQIKFETEIKNKEMEEQRTSESVKKYWVELGGRIVGQLDKLDSEKNSEMSSIWLESLHNDLKIISFSMEQKKKFIEDATVELRNEFRAKRVNIKKLGTLFHTTAKKRAKENAFYYWLNNNKNSKEEIKEEINKAVLLFKPEIFN